MKSKSQRLINVIKNYIYMLKIACKEKKGRIYFVIKILLSLYSVVPKVVFLVFPGLIINELIQDKNINNLLFYVLMIITIPIFDKLVLKIINTYLQKIKLYLLLKFGRKFDYHIMMMDYEVFEDPDIQDLIYRADATFSNTISFVDKTCELLSAFLSLLVVFTILASLNAIIVIVVIMLVLVNAYITKKNNNIQFENEKKLTKFNRFLGQIGAIPKMFMYAKEVRLFDMKDYLANTVIDKGSEANKIRLDNVRNTYNTQLYFSLTNFLQQGIIYAYLIWQVLEGNLSIGNMTIYLSAISQFASLFSNFVQSYLNIAKDSLKIEEYKKLISIPLKQYELGHKIPIISEKSIIEFKNVSFKYPGSNILVLKNINLVLKLNEKICLVGTNGSGKTTLIKLLMRLYLPTEGEILLDGVNINEFEYESYQKLFSPVFQDFKLYIDSIKENIVLNDNINYDKLYKVCNEVMLLKKIQSLPNGFDTQVFKLYDKNGFEPSGGESQRIAIARALYKGAPIYLLDEPTAALDPLIENEIYQQFSNIISNKFAIMITHRLSIVKLTNKIILMDKGEILGFDSHSVLYEKNQFYKNMYDVQAKYYQENK